jgi:transcription initiation factor IIF auxiliary subunit
MITAFKNPPFRIAEEGWGEFDMQITLHAPDKDHYLTHDLNFAQNRYESKHVLVSDSVFLCRTSPTSKNANRSFASRHLKTPSLPSWQPFVNQVLYPEMRTE